MLLILRLPNHILVLCQRAGVGVRAGRVQDQLPGSPLLQPYALPYTGYTHSLQKIILWNVWSVYRHYNLKGFEMVTWIHFFYFLLDYTRIKIKIFSLKKLFTFRYSFCGCFLQHWQFLWRYQLSGLSKAIKCSNKLSCFVTETLRIILSWPHFVLTPILS